MPLLSQGVCSTDQCFSNSVHSQVWTAVAWMVQVHRHTDWDTVSHPCPDNVNSVE